ncbi:MAG: cold shock domain-containing protein [Chloroflexi bacterium]|nr:cold shock domain-containing protein [Chloroflexota bacterium]
MKRRLYEAGLPVEVASLDQLEDVGPPARAEPRPQRSEAPEREEVIGPATIQIDPETGKYVGRLKWYNPARGYGFIARGGGEDIFFHKSGALVDPTGLEEGQWVLYDVEDRKKGPEATEVETYEGELAT